jgi:hypothetical protein
MSLQRSVFTLAIGLGALTSPAHAQGYRVRLDARGQTVSYRGVQLDSIPASQAVTGASGGLYTPDGYGVKCSTPTTCYYFKPGPVLKGVPLSTSADLVVWGLGLQGLSLHASGRLITDAGDDDAWPGTEPTAQLLEGYLEYEANWLRLRGGRLLLASRLQPMGFDGAWARARWRGPSLEFTAYGGAGLGQAAVVPLTSPVLNPLDEWRPVDRQKVAGAEIAWMPGVVDLRAEYRRERDSELDETVSERASLSLNARASRQLRVTGGADYNLDYGELGSADLTLTYLGEDFTVSAGGRRYKPYFDLWTIWGAFSPVPYNGVNASAQYKASTWLSLRTRGEWYRYEAAQASSALVPLDDAGWRVSVGATVTPNAKWTLDGSYLVDQGPTAPSAYFDLNATFQASERLQLGAYGGRLYRPLELRWYDATGTWVGGRMSWAFADQMSVWGDGQYIKDERDRPDAAATSWDQFRLRAGITINFGSDADRRAPLPPARRTVP